MGLIRQRSSRDFFYFLKKHSSFLSFGGVGAGLFPLSRQTENKLDVARRYHVFFLEETLLKPNYGRTWRTWCWMTAATVTQHCRGLSLPQLLDVLSCPEANRMLPSTSMLSTPILAETLGSYRSRAAPPATHLWTARNARPRTFTL